MRGKTFSTLQMQQPKKDGERSFRAMLKFNLHSAAIAEETKK